MSQNINSKENCIKRIAFDALLRKLQGKPVEANFIIGETIVFVYVAVDSCEWRVAFYSDGVSEPSLTQLLYQEA